MDTEVSHETEQGSSCTYTVGNKRIRGLNAGRMHSLQSLSVPQLMCVNVTSRLLWLFSSDKRQKTKQLTVLKFHWVLC